MFNSAKFTSSSDLPTVNHKMLKSCQSSVPTASNWQVTANTNCLKLDDEEHELNDIIEILRALSSAKSNKVDQIVKGTLKATTSRFRVFKPGVFSSQNGRMVRFL